MLHDPVSGGWCLLCSTANITRDPQCHPKLSYTDLSVIDLEGCNSAVNSAIQRKKFLGL